MWEKKNSPGSKRIREEKREFKMSGEKVQTRGWETINKYSFQRDFHGALELMSIG